MRKISGVSEIIGAITILCLAFSVSILILLSWNPMLESSQSRSTLESVKQAFAMLDSRLSRAGLGMDQFQAIHLDLGEGALEISNDSWMRIEIYNASDPLNPELEKEINLSLGSLVYRGNGAVLGYESGGIFLEDSHGNQWVISPPEFHYRGSGLAETSYTLVLPAISIYGNGSIGSGGIRISAAKSQTQLEYSGVLRNSNVYIKLRSDFCSGWRKFLDSLEFVRIVYDRCSIDRTLLLYLVTPEPRFKPFQNAIIATGFGGGKGEISIGRGAELAAYNSTIYPDDSCGNWSRLSYRANVSAESISVDNDARLTGNLMALDPDDAILIRDGVIVNGSLRANGKITIGINSIINGSVMSSTIVDVGRDTAIHGKLKSIVVDQISQGVTIDIQDPLEPVHCRDSVSFGSNAYDCFDPSQNPVSYAGLNYWIEYVPEIQGLEPPGLISIDEWVESKIQEFSQQNDNYQGLDGSCILDGTKLEVPQGGICRIRSGNYYFTGIDIGQGGILELDTSQAPLQIALDSGGDIIFRQDSLLKLDVGNECISGDNLNNPLACNPARFFMGQDSTLDFRQRGSVEITHPKSHPHLIQFWMHSQAEDIILRQNASFYGVIYAAGDVGLDVLQSARACGAVVAGELVLRENQEFWYDEFLSTLGLEDLGVSPLRSSGKIQYLHITSNPLEIKLH